MNIPKITLPANVTRAICKAGFKLKKHSPEILMVAGIAGGVTSAILACKATTKVNFVLEETKDQIDIIHEGTEKGEIMGYLDNGEVGMVPYSAEDSKKDLSIVYAKAGLRIAKLYAPAVALGVASITCILASNNIIHKRNVALAAAYNTLDKSFKDYRNGVVERFGAELDKELKYGIKAKEIEEVVVHEDGTEQTVKKTVEVAGPNATSDYARFFDDGCTGWTKDPETNLVFLKQIEAWANKRLQAVGHLYLNEVYEALGIPHTKAGQIVGWIYDEKNPVGDNYVDFHIYDIYDERKRAFVNGYERVILIDFNVDGNIWELMN
jgi:hypothetical protein